MKYIEEEWQKNLCWSRVRPGRYYPRHRWVYVADSYLNHKSKGSTWEERCRRCAEVRCVRERSGKRTYYVLPLDPPSCTRD